jgi:NAD(P)-dependent dehydrogenase (short-subunit alcohol dehydrogenase family)
MIAQTIAAMKDIREKVVIITGATKGLGAALARGFARNGAKVALCARGREELKHIETEIIRSGGEVFSLPVDIKKPDEVERFASETLDTFGKVDAVINNASVLGKRVPVWEYDYNTWREVIDINVTGVYLMTKVFLSSMIKQRSGSIINLSSGVGNKGKPNWGAYCVSKFGVEGFSYMLAEELREYSIRVNIVNPGGLATDMRRAAYPEEDQSTLKKPEDILHVFMYLVSEASKNLTGSRIDAQTFNVPVRS